MGEARGAFPVKQPARSEKTSFPEDGWGCSAAMLLWSAEHGSGATSSPLGRGGKSRG